MSDNEITRDIACKIAILSECDTIIKSWSSLSQRLFLIATKDWFLDCLTKYEKNMYSAKAKTLTDEDVMRIFNTR